MGDIGRETEFIEFEPFPDKAVPEPAPAPEPVREPVPAEHETVPA